MKCRELMQPDPQFCVPHERLLDALEIMGVHDVGWVPVVDSVEERHLMGIVTARAAAGLLGLFNRRPSEAMCREVMSPAQVVASAEEEIGAVRRRMEEAHVHRLPVLEEGRLAGILSAHAIDVALARVPAERG